jgi:diguanylate cyclase
MFRRSRGTVPELAPSAAVAPEAIASPVEMALDTLGGVLRTLAEFAFDQPELDATAFAVVAERWAQHVLLAKPSPNGVAGAGDSRRDWAGVRNFVADYCRGASSHSRTVAGDLRQVVWVFIQSLSHAVAADRDTDGRVREQLSRLEQLAQGPATSELKKEVLAAVLSVSQLLDQNRERHRAQLETLGAQVQALGTELASARRESETDPLTQLFNRRALDEHLVRSVELHRAFGTDTCLLLADIDRFKSLNDQYGHVLGDDILRKTADVATRTFLRKGDFVARFGGDELAVVLRETSATDAHSLAERLVRNVRAVDVQHGGAKLSVTVSVGVAAVAAGHDVKGWIEATDRCLYRAKQDGRDRAVSA